MYLEAGLNFNKNKNIKKKYSCIYKYNAKKFKKKTIFYDFLKNEYKR